MQVLVLFKLIFTSINQQKQNNMKVFMDVYSRKEGKVIEKFPPVNTLGEAKQALKKYCEENGLQIVAKERWGDSYWNYLSNGTEFDYTLE